MLGEFFAGALSAPHQAARAESGLDPLSLDDLVALFADARQPTVCGWSSIVAPPLADWAPSVHVTGYWTMSVAAQLKVRERSAFPSPLERTSRERSRSLSLSL